MASDSMKLIYFGSYEVTDQVFYNTPHSYCLVNYKPLLPGHVLVISNRMVSRFTDLSANEVTDLYLTVQKVQKMLARVYFADRNAAEGAVGKLEDGAFNIAMQDGVSAGQTVPHVHCHIIPRTKESSSVGDQIYERLEGEDGNVGGALWDRSRPVPGGKMARIDEDQRKIRSDEVMNKEAKFYREQMELVD